jgi:hypothetical protein
MTRTSHALVLVLAALFLQLTETMRTSHALVLVLAALFLQLRALLRLRLGLQWIGCLNTEVEAV